VSTRATPLKQPMWMLFSYYLTAYSTAAIQKLTVPQIINLFFHFIFLFYISGNFLTDDDGFSKCNCMPACTEISYDVETSQAKISLMETLKAAGFSFTDVTT
jgi:hypothetical protein